MGKTRPKSLLTTFRTVLFFILCISIASSLFLPSVTQAGWSVFEETFLKGSISGTVQVGRIFKTSSGNIYQVTGLTLQLVLELSPRVTVLRRGDVYKLIVEGFDEPLLCKLLRSGGGKGFSSTVIESRIDGDFEGFEGETIFKLTNGQIWQQSEYYYHYHYSYMPEVLIYKSSGSYKMKVDGVEKAIGVSLLAEGGLSYPSITPLMPSGSATQGKTGSRSVIITPKQPPKSKTQSRPTLPTIRPTGGKVYHLSTSRLFHRRDCKTIQGKTNLGVFNSRAKAIAAGGKPCSSCNP